MKRLVIIFSCILLSFTLLVSCKKYLEAKSNVRLRLISSLDDMQALMDMQSDINERYDFAGMAIRIADEYYVTESRWNSSTPDDKLNYIWDKNAESLDEYGGLYNIVQYANIVLASLKEVAINNQNKAEYDNIQGQAFFHRSYAFYCAAQLYCKPYSASASADPGIALKLNPDIEEVSSRSTVQQTYDQIINDLKSAASLLPVSSLHLTGFITRPSKVAAYALLSRTFLSMRKYTEAGAYADSCLQLYNTLLDYNLVGSIANSTNSIPPFTKDNNPEIIFYASSRFGQNILFADSFFLSYAQVNDLRKYLFFFGITWKGSYTGDPGSFIGLATDEVYLTRAECFAREGNKDSAMSWLNKLLIKRWKTGTFTPLSATDPDDALKKILTERRKELVFRGTRWMDLRRLNLEGRNISLSRPPINGVTYTLPANDLRWVLLFPQSVINLSQITQNPR